MCVQPVLIVVGIVVAVTIILLVACILICKKLVGNISVRVRLELQLGFSETVHVRGKNGFASRPRVGHHLTTTHSSPRKNPKPRARIASRVKSWPSSRSIWTWNCASACAHAFMTSRSAKTSDHVVSISLVDGRNYRFRQLRTTSGGQVVNDRQYIEHEVPIFYFLYLFGYHYRPSVCISVCRTTERRWTGATTRMSTAICMRQDHHACCRSCVKTVWT